MMKRMTLLCCLLAAMLILAGCGKTETPVETAQVGESSVPVTKIMALELSKGSGSFILHDNAATFLQYGRNSAVSLSGLDDVAGTSLAINRVASDSFGLEAGGGLTFTIYNIAVHSGKTMEDNDIALAAANGGMWGSLAMREVSRSDKEYVALGTDENGVQILFIVRPVEQGVLVFDCIHIVTGTVMNPLQEDNYNNSIAVLDALMNEHLVLLSDLTEEENAALQTTQITVKDSDFAVDIEGNYDWGEDQITWMSHDAEGKSTLYAAKLALGDGIKNLAWATTYAEGVEQPDEFMTALCHTPAVPDGDGYLVQLQKGTFARVSKAENPDENAPDAEPEPPVMVTVDGTEMPAYQTLRLAMGTRFPEFMLGQSEYSIAVFESDYGLYVYDLEDVNGESYTVCRTSPDEVGIFCAAGGFNYNYGIGIRRGWTLNNNEYLTAAANGTVIWDGVSITVLAQSDTELVVMATHQDYMQMCVLQPFERGLMQVSCEKRYRDTTFDPREDEEVYNEFIATARELLANHTTVLSGLTQSEHESLRTAKVLLGEEFSITTEGFFRWDPRDLYWVAKDQNNTTVLYNLRNLTLDSGVSAAQKETYENGAAQPDEFMTALCNTPAVPDGDGYLVKLREDCYARITVGTPDPYMLIPYRSERW